MAFTRRFFFRFIFTVSPKKIRLTCYIPIINVIILWLVGMKHSRLQKMILCFSR